jgi:hypothetical protein
VFQPKILQKLNATVEIPLQLDVCVLGRVTDLFKLVILHDEIPRQLTASNQAAASKPRNTHASVGGMRRTL